MGRRERTNVCFHSLLPRPSASLHAERHKSDKGRGALRGRAGEGASLAGDSAIYKLGAPGQRGQSPPFLSPSISLAPSPGALISSPPPLRARRCGGGSRLRRSSLAKGPAADVRAPAPVNERQRQPGDCSGNEAADVIASCWTRAGGGVSRQHRWLKGKLFKSQQSGRVVPESTCTPKGQVRTDTRTGHARTLTHTRVHSRAHTHTHSTRRCADAKLQLPGA
jgi:hypothetical protein